MHCSGARSVSSRSPFSQEPIQIWVGSYSCVIPHRNAAEWINALSLSDGPNMAAVNLARETSREILLDQMAAGEITTEEVAEASWSLLATGTGYKWWEGARLLLGSSNPSILGRTVVTGMDPWTLTAAQWCAGVYQLCTEEADDRGRLKFDASLSMPPQGIQDDDDSWGAQSLGDMMAQARQMPGMG